jgi:hypothetical protein
MRPAPSHDNLFRFIVGAMYLWARPEAILQLNVKEQVNFEAGLVTLNPPSRNQTKKHRPMVRLTDNRRAWLEHWRDDYPIHIDGEPITTIKKTFKRHAVKLGMPYLLV